MPSSNTAADSKLLLDEPTNHLDAEGLDGLAAAVNAFQGGCIIISHDSTFIHTVAAQLYVCANGRVDKFAGDVTDYKRLIVDEIKHKNSP